MLDKSERYGGARPGDGGFGPGGRDRRPRHADRQSRKDSADQDHERNRPFARRQASPSRLTRARGPEAAPPLQSRTNANLSTSTSPMSVILRCGITGSGRKAT